MRERVRVIARILVAPAVLLLATVASADRRERDDPAAAWRAAFPLANEVDVRALAGMGKGLSVRDWLRTPFPGIHRHADARGAGAGIRALQLLDAPGLASFRAGLGGEIAAATPFHLGFRLRLDVWGTVGRARLRPDGDAHAPADLAPTFVSLSLGMTCVF